MVVWTHPVAVVCGGVVFGSETRPDLATDFVTDVISIWSRCGGARWEVEAAGGWVLAAASELGGGARRRGGSGGRPGGWASWTHPTCWLAGARHRRLSVFLVHSGCNSYAGHLAVLGEEGMPRCRLLVTL